MLKFLSIFNYKKEIRFGVTPKGNKLCYVCVAIDKKGAAKLLFKGESVTPWARFLVALPIHANCGYAPVMFFSEYLHGADPETWVVQNEERLIPGGFSSDSVVNEWATINDTLFSATIGKTALNAAMQPFKSRNLLIATLSAPLWNLAFLYAPFFGPTFVIWKIEKNESLFGFVEHGTLKTLYNFWAGANDLVSEYQEVVSNASALIDSFTSNKSALDIVVYPDDALLPEQLTISGHVVKHQPLIAQIPTSHHEAYADACNTDNGPDFAPFDVAHVARSIKNERKNYLKWAKYLTISLCGISFFLVVVAIGIHFAQEFSNKRLAPIRQTMIILKNGEKHLDSLRTQVTDKVAFLARRSRVTDLITQLQTPFPPGVWADQITINEIDNSSWSIEINALSYSTSLLPEFLKKLGDVSGMGEIRMVYSEQTKVLGKTAIRFRVEGKWKPE